MGLSRLNCAAREAPFVRPLRKRVMRPLNQQDLTVPHQHTDNHIDDLYVHITFLRSALCSAARNPFRIGKSNYKPST